MEANTKPQTAATPARLTLTEDWTVVVPGLLIIALSLTGLIVPTPVFS